MSANHGAGSFWKPEDGETPLQSSRDTVKGPEFEISTELSVLYRRFAAKYGEPKVVWYPCCGYDITASCSFPRSRIIYVDREQMTIDMLKEMGLEAYCQDVRVFCPPTDTDLLVLMNPQAEAAELTGKIGPGCFVACNDYHRTAEQINRDSDFEYIEDMRTGETHFVPVPQEELCGRWTGEFLFRKK